MKAKRRQELKTNDLAAWLEEVRQSGSRWGLYIGIGVAVVLVGVYIKSSMRNARLEARTTAYTDLRKARSMQIAEMAKTEDELRASLATIDDLVASSADVSFKINALLEKANMAAGLAQRALSESDPAAGGAAQATKYVDEARGAYEQITREFRERALFYGRALYGLYQVEALGFVLDGDPGHRSRAEGYLQQLRDDARFNATPLQSVAIEQLKNLERVFTSVEFQARPSPSPTPTPNIAPMLPGPVSPEDATRSAPPPAASPEPSAASDAPAENEGEEAPTGEPEAEAAAPEDVAPEK
jgi:hypothetical protein